MSNKVEATWHPHGEPPCTHEHEIGYEIPGVYDGVLIWVCQDCGHAKPRFAQGTRLYAEAIAVIEGWENNND